VANDTSGTHEIVPVAEVERLSGIEPFPGLPTEMRRTAAKLLEPRQESGRNAPARNTEGLLDLILNALGFLTEPALRVRTTDPSAMAAEDLETLLCDAAGRLARRPRRDAWITDVGRADA
jgi:hypothetical protein